MEQILVTPRSVIETFGKFQGIQRERITDYVEKIFEPDNCFFTDRDPAEKNPELKQLIPYCLFFHESKVLTYERGKSGGEKRLVGNLSIGIGGHINPIDHQEEGEIKATTYMQAMLREAEEEVGIKLDPKNATYPLGLLNDDSNPVGQVHLGVIHHIHTEEPITESAESAIHNLRYLSKTELLENYEQLENWSKLALDTFR